MADEIPGDGPDLADEIAKLGRLETTRADHLAAAWSQWAGRVHRLLQEMPVIWPTPKYLMDDGEQTRVPWRLSEADVTRIRGRLVQVMRDADAVAGAWQRASVDVTEASHAALRDVDADPHHFASLRGGGESRG